MNDSKGIKFLKSVTPLRPVSPRPDREVVATLERLLHAAKAGQVIGIAYVALRQQHQYEGDIVGQALESPLLARGICRTLEDTVAGVRRG